MAEQAQAIANGAPTGASTPVTDGSGNQAGLGTRIWNSVKNTASDIVDAYEHPIDSAIGTLKAIPNFVTGTLETLAQGANAEGIAEMASQTPMSLDEERQLFAQTSGDIHNFFDKFTINYSNSAQAGGAALANIGTAVLGGFGVAKAGLEGLGALDAAGGIARTDAALSVADSAGTVATDSVGAGPLRGPDGRFLSSGESPSVYNRSSQFPGGYRSGVVDEVLDANTIQEGPNAGKVMTADGEIVSRDDPSLTIEHNQAVVEFWNETGYNTSRAVRNDFYNNTDNMSLLLKSTNSSNGGIMSSQGIRYRQDIGPNYSP
jgi:hypothetical protein